MTLCNLSNVSILLPTNQASLITSKKFILIAGQMNQSIADMENMLDPVSEEEHLKSIWRELRVGKDGYLTMEELAVVCEHIGMDEMNSEVQFKLFKSGLLQGRMGWLGGLGPCDIARSVNQPFSYASCSIIFLWGIHGKINPQFYVERYRSLPTRAMLLITYVFSICDVKLGHSQCAVLI